MSMKRRPSYFTGRFECALRILPARGWCILVSLIVGAGSINAQSPYTYLSLESASIQPHTPAPGSLWTRTLFEDQKSYVIYEQGSWHQPPWISPTVFYRGSRGLGFDAAAAPDNQNEKDRGELTLSLQSDANALTFGLRQYVRFAFYVGTGSSAPENFMLIHQVWQYVNSPPGYSPPFAIYVRRDIANPAAPIVLEFIAIDDSHIASPITFFTQQVVKGQWYDVTMQLQPAYTGSGLTGQIAVWFNRVAGVDSPNITWLHDWGYKPDTMGGTPGVHNTFDIRVGVYRQKQRRRFAIFFDEIKVGPTAASVQ
jgi:polysaccharide lyase-like protein